MTIVGGLDIHRKQITFDYLDTGTGAVARGQVCPADREHLAGWLDGRFAAGTAEFALEGCTGWRYVAEELAGAGVGAHLADPAETAAARGRKRRAKTDKTDSRLLRELLAAGRLPECYIPPGHVLDCRAMLQAYHDLRQDRWAWAQRIHAVLFHQGAPPFRGLGTASGPAELTALAAGHLTAAGQRQVAIALAMHAAAGDQIEPLRADLIRAARQLRGARELTARLYGVGPVTALAITCWLGGAGRFASARQAVRFAGLDITVYSSAGKRAPGHLSRQGPAVLRWLLYEAARTHARPGAPGHAYYTAVKDRAGSKPATLSQARRITRQACHLLAALGDDAFTVLT